MDSMDDLLKKFTPPREPAEIALVKQFIQDNFKSSAQVSVKGEQLVITVKSAALASMLRLRSVQLQAFSKTDKRLVFRIQ